MRYHFDGTNCLVTGEYEGGATEIVTESHEQKSMVARSRTKAVGAQGGLGGVISTNSVNLLTSFEFGKTRKEHSAQLTRPIQTVWGYYDQVLRSFQIQPTVTR